MVCTNCNEKSSYICNACKLYHKDAYKIVNNNKIEVISKNETALEMNDEYSLIPFNSIYYYLNEKILFPLEKNEIYSNKIVLVIGSGPNEKRNFALNLQQLRCKRLVCLNEQKTWAFDYFDDWIYADQKNLKNKISTLDSIRSYMRRHNLKFDACMTYYNANVSMTSFITDSLNLPGIPLSTAEKIINKNEFRNLCSSLNINYTQHFLVESAQRSAYVSELEKCDKNASFVYTSSKEKQLKLPLIVKNNFGLGKGKLSFCLAKFDIILNLGYF